MKSENFEARIYRVALFLVSLIACLRPVLSGGEEPLEPPQEGAETDATRLPSDHPSANHRGPRILTGAREELRTSLLELRTSLGTVVGTVEQSTRLSSVAGSPTRKFYAFRGIPYASPPTGALRWADPEPLSGSWERGRLDATKYKSFCPQYDHDENVVVGAEDCLFLNVFSPLLPGMDPHAPGLPVLVFLHGGAYTRGASSSHGPEHLMRQDMVVVTLNYRLGVLGLLSTNDAELPGNYAALDQVAALRWVKRYIAEFGGDPDAVTLGGFSAGAAYVHLHTMSPMSEGLFHRAILMSGSANCLWSVQEDPWTIAYQLAEDLECASSSSFDMKNCLRLKGVNVLLQAQAKRSRYVYWPFQYRPVVDAGNRETPFLPAPVRELMQTPLTKPMPILIGGTPEEGILFALTVLLFSDESTDPGRVFDASSPYVFKSLWPNVTSSEHISENLNSFYYSQNARTDLNILVAEMTDAMTDLLFTSCIWDAAANLASSQAPVYTYLMTHHDQTSPSFGAPLYRLALNAGVTSPLLRHGVSHGDDVILIFNFPYELGKMSVRDLKMSLILTTVFGSFVKNGNPQSRLMSQFHPWEPIKPGDPVYYYSLSLESAMIQKPFKPKERNLWQQTLPLMEKVFEVSEESWSWQIAFWVLLALLLLLLIIATAVLVAALRSRHYKKYPGGSGATLRSQRPRPTSLSPQGS